MVYYFYLFCGETASFFRPSKSSANDADEKISPTVQDDLCLTQLRARFGTGLTAFDGALSVLGASTIPSQRKTAIRSLQDKLIDEDKTTMKALLSPKKKRGLPKGGFEIVDSRFPPHAFSSAGKFLLPIPSHRISAAEALNNERFFMPPIAKLSCINVFYSNSIVALDIDHGCGCLCLDRRSWLRGGGEGGIKKEREDQINQPPPFFFSFFFIFVTIDPNHNGEEGVVKN